jgi:hypothetical protein
MYYKIPDSEYQIFLQQNSRYTWLHVQKREKFFFFWFFFVYHYVTKYIGEKKYDNAYITSLSDEEFQLLMHSIITEYEKKSVLTKTV